VPITSHLSPHQPSANPFDVVPPSACALMSPPHIHHRFQPSSLGQWWIQVYTWGCTRHRVKENFFVKYLFFITCDTRKLRFLVPGAPLCTRIFSALAPPLLSATCICMHVVSSNQQVADLQFTISQGNFSGPTKKKPSMFGGDST
jgi:hypothetical protein